MEEDIKILEEIKDMFIHLKNYGWINDIKKDIDTDKAIQSIENIINRNKELEEENSLLIQQNITYKRNIDDLKHNNIPVSLVEEKIEEIQKEYEETLKTANFKEIEKMNKINFRGITLEGQRSILRELLEKRK